MSEDMEYHGPTVEITEQYYYYCMVRPTVDGGNSFSSGIINEHPFCVLRRQKPSMRPYTLTFWKLLECYELQSLGELLLNILISEGELHTIDEEAGDE